MISGKGHMILKSQRKCWRFFQSQNRYLLFLHLVLLRHPFGVQGKFAKMSDYYSRMGLALIFIVLSEKLTSQRILMSLHLHKHQMRYLRLLKKQLVRVRMTTCSNCILLRKKRFVRFENFFVLIFECGN